MQSQRTVADLSISVVTYNSRDVVGKCLSGLSREICTVLHDNASTDGTAELVQEKFPHVAVTVGRENIGFGRAHNENIRHVSTPFVLVLNPDCFPDTKTLLALADVLRNNPDAAITGPCLWTPEDTEYLDYDPARCSEQVDSDFISGACMMLRVSAFHDIGQFDPNLFLFFEDNDLCTRALRKGYRLIHERGLSVEHLVRASTSSPTLRDILRRDFHLGWSEAYYGCKFRGDQPARRIKFRVIARHSRKTLQRFIRLSPKTIESATRAFGAVAYAYSGPVATHQD
jgi:GT2 family glycosyltransferase